MATDGLSLITVLYGCSTNNGHSSSSSSSSSSDDSQTSSLSQSGKKINGQVRPGISAMGGTAGGGGGGGKEGGREAGSRGGGIVGREVRGGTTGAATTDDRTVEALSHSCNPSFVQKSFMLCKSVLL